MVDASGSTAKRTIEKATFLELWTIQILVKPYNYGFFLSLSVLFGKRAVRLSLETSIFQWVARIISQQTHTHWSRCPKWESWSNSLRPSGNKSANVLLPIIADVDWRAGTRLVQSKIYSQARSHSAKPSRNDWRDMKETWKNQNRIEHRSKYSMLNVK